MIEHRWLLVAAPLIALLIAALAVLARRRRVHAAAAWSVALGEQAAALGRRSPLVLGLAGLVAAAGLAGPRWGLASHQIESRARNIALVMDVSRSMLAQDVAPNRLGRASALARRLLDDLQGDRVALIGFAGRGFLLSPLTLDGSAIAVQLDALDPEMASEGGSALADGLDVARGVLAASTEGGDRAIVVFTDGESFEGDAKLRAAGAALGRAGIALIAVPVGDVRGATIPDPNGGNHRDADGREVITSRRDDLLQLVTAAAGGVMISAGAPDPVSDVRQVLDRLQRATAVDRPAASVVPRAWLFALAAAILLFGHAVTRRSAALAALMLCVCSARAFAQRPAAGVRLLQRGDTARARAAFLNDARRSINDTAWFNAGTSSLVAGDFPGAIDALQRASLSLDPELRRRALYNLGTASLLQARRDTAQRDTLLRAATSELREALLLAPGDANAKYNYELARRTAPPPRQQGPGNGGRGGGASQKSTPSGGRGGMTQAEAEQVLSAMEREEQQARESQYRRANHGEPPRGPDW